MSLANKFDIPPALFETIKKMNEEKKEYDAKVRALMAKMGIKSIGELSPEEKKKFFNTLDAMHKAKNEEVEELDEVSADVAKRVAQARDRSAVANKVTSTQSRRMKMGDKGGDPDMNAGKALKSAMKRGAKNVYGEEVEVEEAMSNDDKSSIALKALVAKKNLKQAGNKVKSVDFLLKMKDRVKAGENLKKEEVEIDEATVPTNTYRPRENGRFVKRKIKGQTHEKDPHGGGVLAKNKPSMNKEEIELEESQVHKIEKQKDGTHKVFVKTEYGEIKHIGTIHPPVRPHLDPAHIAKYKDGSKVAVGKNIDDLAKRLSGYHGKTMREEVEIEESDASWAKSKEMEKEKRLTPSDRDKLAKIRAMMAKQKKPMKEEEEIDEIKDIAKRYLDKTDKEDMPGASNAGLTKKKMRKIHNRIVGINRAMDRVYKTRKEEVEIEEASGTQIKKDAKTQMDRAKISMQMANLRVKQAAEREALMKKKESMREEVEELDEGMSAAQIKTLRDAYASIDKIDVSGQPYKQLVAFLDKQDLKTLKMLAGAKIKFISGMAQNRVVRKMNEDIDESIGSTVGGALGQYAGSKMGLEGPGRVHGEVLGRKLEMFARALLKKLTKEELEQFENESEELTEDMMKMDPISDALVSVALGIGMTMSTLYYWFGPREDLRKPMEKRMDKAKKDGNAKLYHSLAARWWEQYAEEAQKRLDRLRKDPTSVYKKDNPKTGAKAGELKKFEKMMQDELIKDIKRYKEKAKQFSAKERSGEPITKKYYEPESYNRSYNQLFAEAAKKMKKESTSKDNSKSVKSGDKLSGKQEPIEVNPEISDK